MTSTNEDLWRLDSGLREDMVLSIHFAHFQPHADYQNGQQLLLFLIGTDENDDPAEIRMSPGADWATADGGKTIHHPTKKVQIINRNSIYGHWLQHALEIPELVAVLKQKGIPTQADIWTNLVLHVQNREIVFGKNIDAQQRLMPTEFFGLVSDKAPAQAPAMAAPVVAAPVVAPPPTAVDPIAAVAAARAAAANGSAAAVSPQFTAMVELAKTHTTHADFIAAAFSIPEVLADDALAQQVADEKVIWAVAHS